MKKEFLKRVMATSLVAAMALGTAACGGNSSEPAADTKTDAAEDKAEESAADAAEDKAEEPAADAASGESNGDYEECKLTISWWGGDSRHEATQKAIEAFQTKYPGITVEATYGAWDGWEEKMATAFSAGSAQDVNQIN